MKMKVVLLTALAVSLAVCGAPKKKGGDKPKQLFLNAGSWINPSWSR